MGDRTYLKTKLGCSIPHNKHISTKILSILLAILMVTTVFSSITFASDSNDDSTEENNIIASILEDVQEKISSAGSKLGSRLRDLIDRIRENRKGLLSLSLVTRYQSKDSPEIKEKEESTRMRLILPTSIDVDGDGDRDIRVWIIRRPAIDLRPPALCWKTSLIVRRLPGMDETMVDDFLEVYLEYKPRLLSKLSGTVDKLLTGKADTVLDRIRIGYQSPMGEEIPKTCIVSHKNIPHLIYPREKLAHRVAINPLQLAGKSQLNLLFSIADMQEDTVLSELSMQINHTPAVRNEFSIERSKDYFVRRGQTLVLSRQNVNSNVSLYIKEGPLGVGTLTVDDIPKKLSISWKLARDGYLSLDTEGSDTGPVKAAVKGVIDLGFDPATSIKGGVEWNIPGVIGRLFDKKSSIEFNTDSSIILDDIYVNAPLFILDQEELPNPVIIRDFSLDASRLEMYLEGGLEVGNFKISPSPHIDSITGVVNNVDVVLENCSIDVEISTEERPTVTIEPPQNGETVSDIVLITGDASAPDNKEIEYVQLRIDGGDWIYADYTSQTETWSYEWDTNPLPNGDHTIAAQSFDGEYLSLPEIITVTVDNEGNNWYPLISIDSPENGAVVSGIVQIRGTANDPHGAVAKVEIRFNGGKWIEVPNYDGTTKKWTYEWDTTSLSGKRLIEARSFDGVIYSLEPARIQVSIKGAPLVDVDALDFSLEEASIKVTNFVVSGLNNNNVTALEIPSFIVTGSGRLIVTEDSLFVEAAGVLDLQNTSIVITASGVEVKLVDNLSAYFDGYGMVGLSPDILELAIRATLSIHADGIAGSNEFHIGLNGYVSAGIVVQEDGSLIFKGANDDPYMEVNVTDLIIDVPDLLIGADQIRVQGNGSIIVYEKQLYIHGALDTCDIDNFYVNASFGTLSVSGKVYFSGTASLTLTALDPFSFNLSFNGPAGITIEDPEVGIRSPDFGEVSARAEKIEISGIGGYAAFSYKRDEFNVSCHVKIDYICAVGLLVRFNESSYLIGDICGPFEFTFNLSADIKIETGDDWIKITIGGRYRYIKAYSKFCFRGEIGELDVDIELEKNEDTIVINISGIPDNIAVEIDGNTSAALIKKLYLDLPTMVLINISDVNVGFDLHAFVGKGHLLVELNDAQRTLEFGHINVNISDLFDMTIKGNVEVSSSMSGSGILNVTWDESGNLTELYLNANESLEVDVNNLYFSFDDSRNSKHVLLAADQIYLNVNRTTTLVVREDYIYFKGSSQKSSGGNPTLKNKAPLDRDFILKNFKLNISGFASELSFVELDVASLEISGDLEIEYYNGTPSYEPVITVNVQTQIIGNNINISANQEALDLYLVAEIGSVTVTGGGELTIEDNISFISGSSGMDIALEDVYVDLAYLVEDKELIVIVEDLDLGFEGISSLTIESLPDETVIFADVGEGNIKIRTAWILMIGIVIRLHTVVLTGPTNITVSLAGDTMITILTEGTIYAGELSALGFNFYGVKVEPGGLSIGLDSAGNMLLGVHGSINVDQLIGLPDPGTRSWLLGTNMIFNDICINGSLSRLVIGMDTDFKWIRIEGTALESTNLSLEISSTIPPIAVSVEPGDFKIIVHGLDTLTKLGLSLYTDSRLEVYLSDHPFGLNGSIELIGHADIVLDINSFNLNLSAPDVDFNLSGKLNGEAKIHLGERFNLVIRGQCRGYETGKGYANIKVNEDRSGSIRVNWNGTTYIIIPKLVRFSMTHTVDLWIEWIWENLLPSITKWEGEGFGYFNIWIWNIFTNKWCPSWVEGPDYEDAVSLLGNIPGGLSLYLGYVKIIPGDKVNFTALYIPAGYFQEIGLGQQQQQQQQNQGHNPNPLGQEQLTFVFDYGDGYSNTTTVNKPETPIIVHPPENHPYNVISPGNYTTKVTVYDSNDEKVAEDTIRIMVVEEYLSVEGVDGKYKWDYETINESLDEEGKLHAYYVVENIADDTLSNHYELNWTITNKSMNISWGSDWKFEPDHGTLYPGENETVHVSFKPPGWEERGDYGDTIKFIDEKHPDVEKKPNIKLRYGLVDFFGTLVPLYMKDGSSGKTFEDAFWVYSNRWEKAGLHWQINYTLSYANSDQDLNFTADPDNGTIYPGDRLPGVNLTFPPLENGEYRGNVTVERVGDPRDNATIGFFLIVRGNPNKPININLFAYEAPQLNKGESFQVHVEDGITGESIEADYIKVSYYKWIDDDVGWKFVCDKMVDENGDTTMPLQAQLDDGRDSQRSKIKVITDNPSYQTEVYEFYVHPTAN